MVRLAAWLHPIHSAWLIMFFERRTSIGMVSTSRDGFSGEGWDYQVAGANLAVEDSFEAVPALRHFKSSLVMLHQPQGGSHQPSASTCS